MTTRRVDMVYETFVNGGSTLWYDGIERTTGYVVGDNTNPFIPGGGGGMALGLYQVLEALERVQPHKVGTDARIPLPRAASNEYDGVGSWIDGETGLVYLDNVTHKGTIREAMLLAQVNGELDIYDLETKECINVASWLDKQARMDAAERR